MRWAALRIEASDPSQQTVVEQLFYNAGIKGVAIDDVDLPLKITGFVPEDDRLDAQIRAIDTALSLLPELGVTGVSSKLAISFVEEEDWATAWKKYFKPIRLGKHLVVTPPWETPELSDDDLPIVIDPGMAFGTGLHGTTQLCLEAIEQFVFPGALVADIGTGSGILSIAASKLGAGQVYAMDIDPLAVRIAKENAEINHVEIECAIPMPPPGLQYDVVVANILANTLIDLSAELYAITKPGGKLIASGIINHRADDVVKGIVSAGYTLDDQRVSSEWVAQIYTK